MAAVSRENLEIIIIIISHCLCKSPNCSGTYLGVGPSKSEGRLMGKQFTKSQHHSVHKRKKQIDCGTAEHTPDGRRLIKDHWAARGGRRRRRHLVVCRIVLGIGGDSHCRVVELDTWLGWNGMHPHGVDGEIPKDSKRLSWK